MQGSRAAGLPRRATAAAAVILSAAMLPLVSASHAGGESCLLPKLAPRGGFASGMRPRLAGAGRAGPRHEPRGHSCISSRPRAATCMRGTRARPGEHGTLAYGLTGRARKRH